MKLKSIVREFKAIHMCFWESGLGFLSVYIGLPALAYILTGGHQ